VWVKLVIRDSDSDVCAARLDEVDGAVRERLGASLYGIDDDSLPAAAGRALLARGATVATAESCTGGLVGALFTEVAGSSAYYVGGAVTYTNEEKTRQLGVDPAIFVADGAVSEACVTAMACGARDRLGADFAVATSGIAGPGGGTAEKPVGIVWLAVAGPAGVRAKRMFWPSDRDRIRTLAAYWAVSMVLTAAAEPAESAGDAALPPGATP
jgi:nicotinamide-nucleotide amidase